MASNLVQVNWEAQKKVLFSSLGAFRSKEIHTDITLSCDGETFAAHRLVLSMCSGFFKKALHNSTSSSLSLIVMFGIRKSILEALLHFVYDGTIKAWNKTSKLFRRLKKGRRIVGCLAECQNKLKDLDTHEKSAIQRMCNARSSLYYATTIRNDDIPDLLNAGKRLEIPGLMDMGGTSNCNSYNSPKQNDGLETGKNASTSSFSHEVRNSSEGMDFTRNSSEGVDFARNMSEETDFSKKIIKTEVVACSPGRGRNNRKQATAGQRKDMSFDSEEDVDTGNRSQNDIHSAIGSQHLRKLEAGVSKKLAPSKRIHECPICSRRFSLLTSLQEHVELHDTHASTFFPCNNCGKIFISERVFITHVRKCSIESPIIPSVSMTPFKSSRKLHSQNSASSLSKRSRYEDDGEDMGKVMIGSHPKRNFETGNDHVLRDEPGSSSPLNKKGSKVENLSKNNAINLKKSVATLNNRYCTWCSKIFPTIYIYKDHKKSDCKMLECQYCLREFELEKKAEYLAHVSIHSGATPYSCPKCDFVTANESSLENHVALLHTGIYRFWCPLCDFQAMKFNELKAHSKAEHPDILTAD